MPQTRTLRIIAGQWRGRKLRFPDIKEIRPTPDRVRETLFNWLMPVISGARCLDLFAGSGALGLEALSRGAAEVVFCDSNRHITDYLTATLHTLGGGLNPVFNLTAMQYLAQASEPFDIVFLDPPYAAGELLPCIFKLEQTNLLKASARIYLEHSGDLAASELPASWSIIREKRAGQVCYQLASRD